MTTDSDLAWYRRHETERCECGHERREHPRQPFTVPGTPGCTGVVDYGGDCACPRFRYARELDPAPGPLDDLDLETPDDRRAIVAMTAHREWMATRPTRAQARQLIWPVEPEPEAAERCGFSVGGDLARDLEPDVRAWEAEIAADRELFIAQMLREGIE